MFPIITKKIQHDYEVNCFIPEKENSYPLCIGQDLKKCKDCQLRADWEPEDPYGIEK